MHNRKHRGNKVRKPRCQSADSKDIIFIFIMTSETRSACPSRITRTSQVATNKLYIFCEYNVNKPYVYNGIKTQNTAIYLSVKESDCSDTPRKDLFLQETEGYLLLCHPVRRFCAL